MSDARSPRGQPDVSPERRAPARRIRIHRSRIGFRLAGSALGLGFLLLGLYALFGGGDAVDAALRERARGFGVSAVIAGLIAIPVSWLVERLDDIWCAPPRRSWPRARGRDGRDAPRR